MKVTAILIFLLLFGGAALLPWVQPVPPQQTHVIAVANVWILMCFSMMFGLIIGAQIALKKQQ